METRYYKRSDNKNTIKALCILIFIFLGNKDGYKSSLTESRLATEVRVNIRFMCLGVWGCVAYCSNINAEAFSVHLVSLYYN